MRIVRRSNVRYRVVGINDGSAIYFRRALNGSGRALPLRISGIDLFELRAAVFFPPGEKIRAIIPMSAYGQLCIPGLRVSTAGTGNRCESHSEGEDEGESAGERRRA